MAQLQAGRYAVVRTSSILGTLVRHVTRSPFDQAVICAGDRVIEVVRGTVRVRPAAEYVGAPMASNTGEAMTAVQLEAVLEAARGKAGIWYGQPGPAALNLSRPWRLLVRITGAGRRLASARLVAEAGQAAGLDWMCGKSAADQVTPADLARRNGMEPVAYLGAGTLP